MTELIKVRRQKAQVRRTVLVFTSAFCLLTSTFLSAQRGRGGGGQAPAPPTPQAAAPIDLTGDWVSIIVDEWRFRVTPQKGDILYLPLNNEARQIANAWDPAKDDADGKQCKAYGAVGVMQRPGRLHVTWADTNTLKIEADAGTQTRVLHFGAATADKGPPSWQGYSTAEWQMPGGGRRGAPAAGPRRGNLKVVTSNMLPGYIRKNGVPYSDKAVLTEYFALLSGEQSDAYIAVTAMVDDPMYLTQPFVRTYNFKKLADATGWDPTPCWNR
jgi:hypothetical protein